MNGDLTYWDVAYELRGSMLQSTVVLEEGYTTVEDIPKIIAIKKGVQPEEIKLFAKIQDFSR